MFIFWRFAPESPLLGILLKGEGRQQQENQHGGWDKGIHKRRGESHQSPNCGAGCSKNMPQLWHLIAPLVIIKLLYSVSYNRKARMRKLDWELLRHPSAVWLAIQTQTVGRQVEMSGPSMKDHMGSSGSLSPPWPTDALVLMPLAHLPDPSLSLGLLPHTLVIIVQGIEGTWLIWITLVPCIMLFTFMKCSILRSHLVKLFLKTLLFSNSLFIG